MKTYLFSSAYPLSTMPYSLNGATVVGCMSLYSALFLLIVAYSLSYDEDKAGEDKSV